MTPVSRILTVVACVALLLGSQGCVGGAGSASDSQRTVVFLTDFGESDFYVGAVKGVIRTIAPNVTIDDLGHQLEPYDVRRAAWNLYLAAREYPSETVVLAVVDPGVGTERRPIVLRAHSAGTRDGKLFVGPDNGLFTLIVERLGPVEVRHITNRALMRPGALSGTFHGRDIFGPTAAHLAVDTAFEEVGPRVTDFVLLPITAAERGEGEVRGEVISADHYGNLHTNIPGEMLLALGVKVGDLLHVTVGEVSRQAPFVHTYGEVPEGEPLVLIASTDHLEIAVNMASAQKLFSTKPGAQVRLTTGP